MMDLEVQRATEAAVDRAAEKEKEAGSRRAGGMPRYYCTYLHSWVKPYPWAGVIWGKSFTYWE